MMSDEEKPPAPPLRNTSNQGHNKWGCAPWCSSPHKATVSLPVDMRPLPKEPEEKPKHKPHKMKKSKDHHEKPNISYPTKFTHVVHVGFDDDSGEFTGMPEAWTKLLVASNISKEMQMQNPQAVLDVLNYYEHSSKKTEDKYMTQTPSTDPSPRPSYSVSSHALSSPSSQSSQPVSGVSPSPPVSCASVPSPVLPEPPLGPTSTTQGVTRLTSSSSNTPSVFSTTPDQEDTEEDAEPAPPPIATRPERTKSIYTKPVDSDEETTPSLKLPPTINENDLYDKSSSEKSNNNHTSSTAKTEPPKSGTPREKKKKMTGEEILAKLRQIVSIGDPNRKYTKMEKIGQG